MITLITGVPGSGKTLYAMQRMEKQAKEGREIFSDIENCTLPGVQPAPDDWRKLPDGALCVYDEAHQRFPATGKAGLSADGRVQDLDTHRHHGYDLIYITQASTRLHHDIRKLAGEHVHVQRNFGAKTVTLYRWERAANENDKQDREQSDQQLWHYPKRLFSHYHSATIHTHKRRIPAKLVGLSVIAAGLIGLSVYWFSQGSFIAAATEHSMGAELAQKKPAKVAKPEPVTFAPPGGRMSWASNEVVPAVAGCISSASDCQCYAQSGMVIVMTDSACRKAMAHPLPISIGGGGGRSRPARIDEPGVRPVRGEDVRAAVFSGGGA